ncbi:hypothetical protein JL101_035405 (plasmid) [Skermanella rosea]|uniref:hypothetical protein n=1 Tax=Skermanella rosea TaxID=1817965 RepID=UPI0019327CBA|nr:hypothetical protein [Skermanella rosea]UEM08086.1 hypothetical protein JL101_035405 [Skermanella rosea]
MGHVCALQKQYGKTGAELEVLVEGFCWVLQGYAMDVILDALRQYVAVPGNSDIPAPSDIIAIIDPPEPPLSAAMYVSIRKKMVEGRVFVPPWEVEYVREFERRELAKVRGGSEALREAQKQVEQWKMLTYSTGGEA